MALLPSFRRSAAPRRSTVSVITRSLHIAFGTCSQPHPDKATSGGEDAFFADDSLGVFGVADGVGGSKREGADPGLFSRQLLKHCHDSLQQQPSLPAAAAAASAGFQQTPIGGSSTLLLGQLDCSSDVDDKGVLRLFNLGDSGALLYRPCKREFKSGMFLWPRLVLRSNDQTHFFNCPYQVSSDDFDEAIAEADLLETPARAGDIVVAASDGVLDNLFEARIQRHVALLVRELHSPDPTVAQAAVGTLATAIAQESTQIGLREDEKGLQTPFMVSAAQEGLKFVGGKLDDVVVVCGVVRSDQHLRPKEQSLSNC